MSKAFTKDDDGAPQAPLRAPMLAIPVPNPITQHGYDEARAELEHASGDRASEIVAHLATAVVTPPEDRAAVGFGARVTVAVATTGKVLQWRFVGAIEADVKRGNVSWQAEIARILWGARVGDTVELPRGVEAEVTAIDY